MDIGPRVASLGGGVRLGFPTIELGGEVSGYRRGGNGVEAIPEPAHQLDPLVGYQSATVC